MLARQISEEMKDLIREGYPAIEVQDKIYKKYGNVDNYGFWYQCCYNSVCEELGLSLKKGEKLKSKKVKLKLKGKKRD